MHVPYVGHFILFISVDMITGRPCIDFLDDYSKWQESYSLSFILITIQVHIDA